MSDYDGPGEGWKLADTAVRGDQEFVAYYLPGSAAMAKWVRDEPVLPLPTERDTVIRPIWKRGVMHTYTRLVLCEDNRWWRAGAGSWNASASELLSTITGFKVLARPIASQ